MSVHSELKSNHVWLLLISSLVINPKGPVRSLSTGNLEECPTDCSLHPDITCRIQEEMECPSGREPLDGEVYAGPPSSLQIELAHVSQYEGTQVNVSFTPPDDGTHQHVEGFAMDVTHLNPDIGADVCYVYNTSGANWTPENANVRFTRSCDTYYDQQLLYSVYTLPRHTEDERMQQAIVTIKPPFHKDIPEPGTWLFQIVIYNNSCQQEVTVEFLQMPDEYNFKEYRVFLLRGDACLSGYNCDRTAEHISGQKMQRVSFDNVLLGEEYKIQIKAEDPYHSNPNDCLCQSRCREGNRCLASNSATFSMPKYHPSCMSPPQEPSSEEPPGSVPESTTLNTLTIGLIIGVGIVIVIGLFVALGVVITGRYRKCTSLKQTCENLKKLKDSSKKEEHNVRFDDPAPKYLEEDGEKSSDCNGVSEGVPNDDHIRFDGMSVPSSNGLERPEPSVITSTIIDDHIRAPLSDVSDPGLVAPVSSVTNFSARGGQHIHGGGMSVDSASFIPPDFMSERSADQHKGDA